MNICALVQELRKESPKSHFKFWLANFRRYEGIETTTKLKLMAECKKV